MSDLVPLWAICELGSVKDILLQASSEILRVCIYFPNTYFCLLVGHTRRLQLFLTPKSANNHYDGSETEHSIAFRLTQENVLLVYLSLTNTAPLAWNDF